MMPEDNSSFPREKEELPWVGLEPTNILCSRQTLYQLSHQGSSAGQAESLKFIQANGVSPLINKVTQPQR